MTRLVCDRCGCDDLSVVSNGLVAKCEWCGAYVELDNDEFVDVEKMGHKAAKKDPESFVTEDMWYGMLRGFR